MTRRIAARTGRRYRGRSTEQLRAERRQRLMETALAHIGSAGYASLTIEKLCSAAKVSTRHFYEHFRSREALLAALLQQFAADAARVIAERLAEESGDPVERALSAVSAFVRFALADPARARLAFIETVGVSPQLEAQRRAAIGRFTALITEAASHLAERGALPRQHYHLAAVALVGAVNELLVEWLDGRTGLSASGMERAVTDLFRTLILGARARGAGPQAQQGSP